jgi:outer membrane lipoprotein SlyB
MRKHTLPVCALALAAMAMTVPNFAEAHKRNYRHHHRHYASQNHNNCATQRHNRGRNGAIIGAVGGAVVANSLARGNRTGGTLLGAGVGALAGHEIGKNSTRCGRR